MASAELRHARLAAARTANTCQNPWCDSDPGVLTLVHRSEYDHGDWWRCGECRFFYMTPKQAKKNGLWWGGPRPPFLAHKSAPPRGRPHANLDEQGFRAEQGMRVYAMDASVWMHGPTTGRRLAELGIIHAEVYVMCQAQDRLYRRDRLGRAGVQQHWPLSRESMRRGLTGCIRPEYQQIGGTMRSRSLG